MSTVTQKEAIAILLLEKEEIALILEKEILTPLDVQKAYNFSVSTLAKWRMKRKNLEFFRLGNFIRYRRSAIESFINKNMIEVAQ